MVSWKEYIKKLFYGKKIRIETDCMLNNNTEGQVVGVEWSGTEAILCIMVNSGKITKVGTNTNGFRFKIL